MAHAKPKPVAKKGKPKTVKARQLEKQSKSIKDRGGKRPGAGRKAGVPNKVTRELGAAARVYTAEVLEVLAKIARSGKSESARVTAAIALLDRGHGRPKQQIDHSSDSNIGQVTIIKRIIVDPNHSDRIGPDRSIREASAALN